MYRRIIVALFFVCVLASFCSPVSVYASSGGHTIDTEDTEDLESTESGGSSGGHTIDSTEYEITESTENTRPGEGAASDDDSSTISSILGNIFDALFDLLPESPFQKVYSEVEISSDILGYLNWFFPISTMVVITDVWLICILCYYIYITVRELVYLFVLNRLSGG